MFFLKKKIILETLIALIYLNFFFSNVFFTSSNFFNSNIYSIHNTNSDIAFSEYKYIFTFVSIILLLFFFIKNYKSLYKEFVTNYEIKFLILGLLFGIIVTFKFFFFDLLIFFNFCLTLFICAGTLVIFYKYELKKLSRFVYYLIIIVNILLLISLINYFNIFKFDLVLFGKILMPSNPMNQKFIFLLLNSIMLLKFFQLNNSIQKNFFIILLIISNLFILLNFSNTYSYFLSLFFIIYFLVFKVFFYDKKKNFMVFFKFTYTGIFLIMLIIPILHITKSILTHYLSYEIKKNITLTGDFFPNPHQEIKCFDNQPTKVVPEFFRNHNNVPYKYKLYLEYKDLNCFDNVNPFHIINKSFKVIGLLSRFDQIDAYKKNASPYYKFIFVGMAPSKYKEQLTAGNFTHNSYYNMSIKYGVLFTLIVLYFLFILFIKKQSIYFDMIFLIIMSSQIFDDYLIGNRTEMSQFMWFLFGYFVTTKKKYI